MADTITKYIKDIVTIPTDKQKLFIMSEHIDNNVPVQEWNPINEKWFDVVSPSWNWEYRIYRLVPNELRTAKFKIDDIVAVHLFRIVDIAVNDNPDDLDDIQYQLSDGSWVDEEFIIKVIPIYHDNS
jgi:hypothetical protein